MKLVGVQLELNAWKIILSFFLSVSSKPHPANFIHDFVFSNCLLFLFYMQGILLSIKIQAEIWSKYIEIHLTREKEHKNLKYT